MPNYEFGIKNAIRNYPTLMSQSNSIAEQIMREFISGVGNHFPWCATLSQQTWLLGSILTSVTAFNILTFIFIHNSWGHLRAGCNIVAGRIWPVICPPLVQMIGCTSKKKKINLTLHWQYMLRYIDKHVTLTDDAVLPGML